MSKFTTLEDILGKDQAELTALRKGEFETEKLGTLPFTAIDHAEYKQAKKDCMKMVPDGTGGMVPDIDEDKLMTKVIIAAVNKDDRSNFTFASKELLKKLQEKDPSIVTAEAAATALLLPGEIFKMAMAIQNISGFGPKAKKEVEEAVKNS